MKKVLKAQNFVESKSELGSLFRVQNPPRLVEIVRRVLNENLELITNDMYKEMDLRDFVGEHSANRIAEKIGRGIVDEMKESLQGRKYFVNVRLTIGDISSYLENT
ncbi:hypothetical protein ACOME3_001536 [Neoechinorhynchus agilis]